jgi:hypothetical protein
MDFLTGKHRRERGLRAGAEQAVMDLEHKLTPNYVTYKLTYPKDTPKDQAVNVMWSLAGVGLPRSQGFVYETYGNSKGWWQYLSIPPGLNTEQLFRTSIRGLHVEREGFEQEWDDGMEIGLSDVYRPLRLGDPAGAVASMLSHFTPLGDGEALLLQWVFIPARIQPKKPPKRANFFAILGGKQIEEDLYKAKTSPPSFLAVARVAVKGPNPKGMLKRVGTTFHSLRADGVHFTDRHIPWSILRARIIERSVPMNFPIHLTDLELATVLPIPFGNPNVPGMAQHHTRHIWADDSVPSSGFVFGDSTWPSSVRAVAFDPTDCLQHTHYEGQTGTGKSNTMTLISLKQMELGHGVGFIDPTGDAIDDLIARIPENRWDDVILVDPTDTQFPVGINVFEGTQDPSVRADQLMAIIAGIYKDNGIYVSNYLRAAIQALASVQGSTLVDVPAFMKDVEFRRSIIEQCDDAELYRIWREFERLKDSEKEARIAPALHRVQPLLMRPSVRLTLGQSSGLDFGRILSEGKILLVSIPKGRIGEDTAILIGSSIVSRIWQEAQARPRENRKPYFYLSIDEAPNFLNMPTSLDTVFSEARKFGLGLAIANQHEAQWPAKERAAIHANTRNKLMFKVSIDDALMVSRMLGVTQEDMLGLGPYEAIMRTPNGAPATVKTRRLPDASVTPAAIRARSRRQWGRPRAEVDKELQERYGASGGSKQPRIG